MPVSYAEIAGLGTPEARWQAWPGLAALPVVGLDALVPAGSRLVVVAPHPDDELLATGGLLALAHAAGRPLLLVAASDGTASHPGSARWTPQRLAVARPAETREALRRLDIDEPTLVRLELPDGAVRAEDVHAALAGLLRSGDVVVATWRHDAHPDHEAVGQAAARACAGLPGVRLLEVPVWTWHWAEPGDARVPWDRALRLDLGPELAARKVHAVEAYVSQVSPDDALALGAVLPGPVLDRLLRTFEVVFG